MKQEDHNYFIRAIGRIYSHIVVREFMRFGLIGLGATLLHYGIYYILQKWINVNIAYSVGYITSFIFNFYLTSFFTFKVKPTWKKFFGLAGAHLFNYLMHMVLLNFFLWIGLSNAFAPVPVFTIVIPCNFLLVRYVFKSQLFDHEK